MWDMELWTQLMRHWVTNPEEGVGKRNTGDGGSIVYALTRHRIFGSFGIAGWQILFQQFQCLQRLSVRVFIRQHWNISFQRVGYGIQTAEGAEWTRHIHHQVGIDNRHIRRQRVVSERIFLTRRIIGHYSKRCDFWTGTGRGGNGNHARFDTHFRELVDTFTDIHET